MLPPAVQAEDPMLAGVREFAQGQRVDPATAEAVTRWTAPVLPDPGGADEDRRLAATLLALAAMRSEPNMRTEQAMQWALRKRWIGLDARGRAMLAMAVLANSGITAIPPEFAVLAKADLLGDPTALVAEDAPRRRYRDQTSGTSFAVGLRHRF